MTASTLRLKPGEARWSQACKCPRMAAYGLRGAEERPRSEREQRFLHRGRLFGRFVAEQFQERYGKENVVAEKEVPWPEAAPLGNLHTDVFVIPEAAAFEVKSTTHPDSLIEDAILQNAGEQHFDPDCDKGGVILVDPVSLDEQVIPVVLNDELRERVESIATQVTAAGKTGPLPERVCERPSDAIGKMCPFASVCFADEPAWEPEPAISLNGDHAELVAELYHADREVKSRQGAVEEAAAKRDQVRAELREAMEPNREYECGGLKLKRSVFPRTSYKTATAIKAGIVSEELLAPFASISETERWYLERVGDLALPVVDFGDVPF